MDSKRKMQIEKQEGQFSLRTTGMSIGKESNRYNQTPKSQ